MAELTNKQRVFVEEYLRCWNATEAARLAGYKFPNVEGTRLLVNASIAEHIKARMAEKAMAADEVLARLADHARGDMREFLVTDDDGKPSTFNLGQDRPLHLVKKVSITDKGISFELYDAQSALQLIGKAQGLFVDRQEVSGRNGGPIVVEGFDYNAAIANIAPRSGDDSPASGED